MIPYDFLGGSQFTPLPPMYHILLFLYFLHIHPSLKWSFALSSLSLKTRARAWCTYRLVQQTGSSPHGMDQFWEQLVWVKLVVSLWCWSACGAGQLVVLVLLGRAATHGNALVVHWFPWKTHHHGLDCACQSEHLHLWLSIHFHALTVDNSYSIC